MDMHGKNGDRPAPLRQYPTEFAIPPAAHDGISRALRDAFATSERNLPADWDKLLDKLN